jgi:hypothetical protein
MKVIVRFDAYILPLFPEIVYDLNRGGLGVRCEHPSILCMVGVVPYKRHKVGDSEIIAKIQLKSLKLINS